MEVCLSQLKYHFDSRNHLQSLLPNEPITFCICTEKETWIVSISKNQFSFAKSDKKEDIYSTITTVESVALVLLSGIIRLSTLKKHNEIVYEGSFRNFLLLESIFWLCRDYNEHVEAVAY